MPDLDIVWAYAAIRERDLLLQFNPSFHAVVYLKDESPHECFVQYFSSSIIARTKADHVILMNTLDALDALDVSTSDMLWLAQYIPQESAAHAQGVAIPCCRKGFLRATHLFETMTFSPLLKEGDRSRGFQMTTAVEMELPSFTAAILSMIPNILMKMLCSSVIDELSLKFRDFVQNSADLQERLTTSRHACFYEQLRQRLTTEKL